MKLARGAVISLDQRVGDPVDIVVNGTVVARGEIVVVDEVSQRFGVSLLEIVAGANLDRAACENGSDHGRAHQQRGAVFQRPGKSRRPASDAGRAGGGAASEALR